VPIVKLDIWIWRSFVSECLYVCVRVEPIFMTAYSFPPIRIFLSSLTASVLIFTLSFKDLASSILKPFVPFRQVKAHYFEVT
jgi:hypothetical protein